MIEQIAPARLQSAVDQTRGRLFVLLSSTDKNCGFCVEANPRYSQLADKHPNAGRFIMSTWNPWTSVSTSEFLKSAQISGLPTYLVYRDGVIIARANGNSPLAELEQKLVTETESTPPKAP